MEQTVFTLVLNVRLFLPCSHQAARILSVTLNNEGSLVQHMSNLSSEVCEMYTPATAWNVSCDTSMGQFKSIGVIQEQVLFLPCTLHSIFVHLS